MTISTVRGQLSRPSVTSRPARLPIRQGLVAPLLALHWAPLQVRRSGLRRETWERVRRLAPVLVYSQVALQGDGRFAGGSLQARYDTVYAQCMTAKGNRVAAPYVVAEPVYVDPRPYNWGPGYYERW